MPQANSNFRCPCHDAPQQLTNPPTLALHILQSLLMSNPHNFPVDYEWEPSSPAFVVTPASGLIKPKSTAEVVVRWKPAVGAAAAANAPAAAAQSAVEVPQGPKGTARNGKGGKAAVAGPAAASQQGAGAGGKAASDAGAGGTAAAQAAVGLVQSAVMTLRLKGGADMPQRVALVAELPGGCLKSKEKEVLLGAVPVGEPQTVVLQLKNTGAGEAAFRVSPCFSTWHLWCGRNMQGLARTSLLHVYVCGVAIRANA